MKNQFTENYIRYDEMIGIVSSMTVEELILESEANAANDRLSFKAMAGK